MSAIIHGLPVIFGVVTPLPLKGFPEGKKAIEMNPREFVVVLVENNGVTRKFYLGSDGENWIPILEKQHDI